LSVSGAFVIPALDAERSLGSVLAALSAAWHAQAPDTALPPIVVVDDGSLDRTAEVAREHGALVLTHAENRGKGAALQTALAWALDGGISVVVSLDADGQHPADAAVRLLLSPRPQAALLIGLRDLAAAGAPAPNRFSNRLSNVVLSFFGGEHLLDTQCGLRRYPVVETTALGARDPGFAFEADVVLRAARRGLPIEHVPFQVFYPPKEQRVTHFHSVKDPARIVVRVLSTVWSVPHVRWRRRVLRYAFFGLVLACAALSITHGVVRTLGAIEPPAIEVPTAERTETDGIRRAGTNYALRRNGIWEVGLRGRPEEIGWAHGKLLYEQMVANEGRLFGAFEQAIPSWPLRTLVLDLAVFGYRDVNHGMSAERQRELAAQARSFSPDPYERFFPTFQRFVYLSALYDISLSFEYSPLIGCTTFTADEAHSSAGGPLLARAFDFEVDDIFDEQKAVFFVREDGQIPFASVAWPGLVGVVSGMNAEGVAIVVHGARAGETTTTGEPVVHALRRVLSTTRTTAEALAALAAKQPMVSHLVIVNDRHGDARAIERIPGREPFARTLPGVMAVTNHLEGPARDDPKNQRVLSSTSTQDRRARGDALIRLAQAPVGVIDLVAWLRDQNAADGASLPPGDRRAIDAMIATHGVVMNTKTRELWVSQSPHLSGKFVRFELERLLAEDYCPDLQTVWEAVPAAAR